MYYLYIFIGFVLLKFLYNLCKYIENFKLYRIWKNYFKNLGDKKSDVNAITYTKEIENHFKGAKINDYSIPIAEPIGMGQIAASTTTAFSNIFANDKRIFPCINDAFLQARGVYRSRMKDCFKPSYWIKLIIFLPKNIISYLGLNTDTIFTKIFQIIFWIIDSMLIVAYQDVIIEYIKMIVDYLVNFFTK